MGGCVSRNSGESELAKQVLGSGKADAKTVRRLSALGIVEGEVWVTRQTSDIRKVFRFGAQLNKGQFGTIHVVTNTAGEKFACKQISKRKLVGTASIRDVRREIEILHHLRGHPNVITFHGAYEDADDVYLVMELCTGGDLFERIEKITTITERAAASVFRELVETVSYCHTLGVVHRDLKPENFLITDRSANSRIKLADFGLSCFFQEGRDEELHDIVGSAYYMAPEVVRRQYGRSCDIWSLGVILHILLAGSPPFSGNSDADILRAVRTQEVDLTVAPWPSISRHARHLVSKMLEKDLDKRIRLDQVLSHPWLRPDGTAPPRALHGGLRERIGQFRVLNLFKREARRVLVGALPPEEVSGLKLLFEALDTDQNGLLSFEELREGLARRGELQEDTDVRALLKAADLNCDGFLDYREFVAATYTLSRLQRSKVLIKAFQHFDLNGDGYITKEELASVLSTVPLPSPSGDFSGGHSISKLMTEADLDSDGRVDYREFCAMMLAAEADKVVVLATVLASETGEKGGGGGKEGAPQDGSVRRSGAGAECGANQVVQLSNLPGMVENMPSRVLGCSSSSGSSRPLEVDGGGRGGSGAAGATTRRSLSIRNRVGVGSTSTRSGVGSTSNRGGVGSTSNRGGVGSTSSSSVGGSHRPSQPSAALTAVAVNPPAYLPPQGRISESIHGSAGGGRSTQLVPLGVPLVVLEPEAGDCSDDDQSSEDSVMMMAIAGRQHPPPLTPPVPLPMSATAPMYSDAIIRKGPSRSNPVVVLER